MNKKMLKLVSVLIILVLIAGLSLTSCSKKNEEKKVIKIGAILPLTGNLSVIGLQEKKAFDVYLKNIGVSKNIKIVYGDFQSKSSLVSGVVSKLINIDKVDLLWVSTSSASQIVKEYVKNNKRTIKVFVNTSLPGIEEAPYVYRIAPNSYDEITMVKNKIGGEGYNKVLFVFPENDLGMYMKKIISESLEKDDINFKIIFVKIGTSDFSYVWNEIRFYNPDCVVFEQYPKDIVSFFHQYNGEYKGDIYLSMAALWVPKNIFENYKGDIFYPEPSIYYKYENNKISNSLVKDLIEEYLKINDNKINYDVFFVWAFLYLIDNNGNKIDEAFNNKEHLEIIDGTLLPNGNIVVPLKWRRI